MYKSFIIYNYLFIFIQLIYTIYLFIYKNNIHKSLSKIVSI